MMTNYANHLLSNMNQIFLNELSSVHNWKREQTLGFGSFAIITLWVNTDTNQRIALKQNRTNFMNHCQKQISYYEEKWRQEIQIMKQLKCENVVKAFDLPKEFNSLQIKSPILAMEYCSGGDLRKVLNKPSNCCGLSEKEVRQILKQISIAIIYLHDLKIIHRDLKPENIVIQPLPYGKILYKLTDLGYAKQLSDTTSANSFVGTLEYLAPELFLGVKYSSAVDNWSFGLLAYEIITGRRPFLPNHSMTNILEALKKKKSSEICTEVDSKGDFYFSKEISYINHISNNLKNDLEIWLRIILEYDPERRGGREAFQIINRIMNKYNVQVFSVYTYETFSYEIDSGTHIDDLKEKIFSSTNTIPKNQYLFFQNGDIPKDKIGQQIINTWYTPESWFERYNPIVIFMFDYSKELQYQEFYKFLILPKVVENMLLNANQTVDYDELNFTWRSSVFVARQTVKKYTLVHETLKSCILNCINMFGKLQNENQTLLNSLDQTFSSVNVLEKLFKTNYYHSKNNDHRGDTYNNEYYKKIYLKLKALYTFRKVNVTKHLEKSEQIIPKFDKETFVFEDFFKSPEIEPSLMNKYVDIQNAYDLLRKKKKEFQKYISNNLMLKLLCYCFELVETLMKKMFKVLSMLITFIQHIDQQQQQCQLLQNEINKWKLNDLEELYQIAFTQQMHNCLRSTESPSECLSSNIRQLSLNNEIDELILEFEREDSLWKTKVFDFNKLEFNNFLF